MSKHTPGPWRVYVNGIAAGIEQEVTTITGANHYYGQYVAVVGGDGDVICDNAEYYDRHLDPKNANLIAAAPCLLEALEALLPIAVEGNEYIPISCVAEIELARSAIARAKGVQP